MHGINYIDEAGLIEVASIILSFIIVGGVVLGTSTQNYVSAYNLP